MQATSTNFKTTIAGNEVTTDVKVTFNLPVVRHNLCPNPNSIYSAYGWVGSNSGTTFGPGAFGMGIGWANSGAAQNATMPVATRPGSVYTVQAQLQPVAAGAITGGVAIGALGIGQGTPLTSGPLTLTSFTFTATGYVTNVGAFTQGATSGSAVSIVRFLMVEESATAGSYFDGDTAAATWDGIPEQSTSTLNVDPYPDMTLAVESIEIDRQMVTDLPDGTKSVTGYPAAGGTVVLSGLVDQTDATKTAAWLCNVNDPTSPSYRLDLTGSTIVVQAGVANQSPSELVPLLTGVVDKVTVDMQAGTVTLDCLDNRGKIRSANTFPGVAASQMKVQLPASGGATLGSFTPGLTGLWALDWLLRANHIYASTGPRPGCGFYASMAGGAFPQIYGTAVPVQADLSNDYADEAFGTTGTAPVMQYVAGNWTPQVCRDAAHAASLAQPIILNGTGNGWHCEFGLNGAPPAASVFVGGAYQPLSVTLGVMSGGTLSNQTFWSLTYVSGTTWAFKANDTTAHNVTISAAEHVVDVQVNGAVFTLWVDGVQLGQWTSANSPASVTANYVVTNLPYAVEGLQVTNEPNGQPRTIATPTADLDASLNTLVAIPAPGTADAWQIIQQIAQAEGGIAGFDETGLFTFTNRQTLAGGASVRTITSSASLKSLQVEVDSARIATHVQLPVNALGVQPWAAVWAAGTTVSLTPWQVIQVIADLAQPATAMATISCHPIPIGGVNPTNPQSGYRACRTADGAGAPVENLTMNVTQVSPTRAIIGLGNPNNFPVYLVGPTGSGVIGTYPTSSAGQPCLVIGGTVAAAAGTGGSSTSTAGGIVADSQWPPLAEGGAVKNAKGDIQLILPANPWVQDQPSAQSYTDDLLGELYMAKPFWSGVAIVADPSLQLADRVTVNDPDATGISDDAIIASLKTTISATQWQQDVDMRATSIPGYLQLGVTGRSELGSAYV